MATGKLTDGAVTTLQQEAKQTAKAVFLWDTEVKGLGVRVAPTGQVSWLYRYFLGTQSKRLTFAARDAKDARLQAHGFKVEVAKGVDLLSQKATFKETITVRETGPTLQEASEKYLAARTNLRGASLVSYRRALCRAAEALGKDTKVAKLTKAHVLEMLHRLQARGKHTLAYNTRAYLEPFFDWCVEWDYMVTSPLVGIKRLPPPKRRERFLNSPEVASFWKACDTLPRLWPQYHKLVLLTAQRKTEVAHIKWTEIDLVKRIWTIPASRTKNKLEHVVHLSQLAIDILATIPHNPRGQWLFTIDGDKPYNNFDEMKGNIDAMMKPVVPWVLHDLRRTAATHMENIGIHPHVIERVLNHAKVGIRGVYQRHDYMEERREAMDRWSKKILDITSQV